MPNFDPTQSARNPGNRDPLHRFPGNIPREEIENELVRQEAFDRAPDLEGIAKLVVVAGGAYAAGRMIGRDNLVRMMDWVSTQGYRLEGRALRPGRNLVDKIVLGNVYGTTSITSGGAPNRITPDLALELQSLYKKYDATGHDAIRWLHGPNRTGVDYHAQYLADRFTGAGAPRGLSHLTVGDVFGNQTIRDQFDASTISVLQKARTHGIIHDTTALSASRTFGLFKDNSNRVLDTQGFSPLKLFDASHKALRQFTIPFTDWKPADLIFGAIRPMVVPARHTTIGGHQLMPDGTTRVGGALNFSMGDKIFSQAEGRNRFNLVASGVKVYDISGEGSHFYGRAVAIKQGRIANSMNRGLTNRMVPANQPVRHFWQRLQDTLGIGPEFSTNRSAWGLGLDALERRSIARGRSPGAFVANANVPRRSAMGRVELARAQSAFNQGLIPNQSRYETVDQYLDEAVPAPTNIPFFERVKATLFDNSRTGSYYSVPPGPGFPGRKVGAVHNPRTPTQGYTPVGANTVPVVGPGGIPATTVPASGVADSPGFMNSFNLFMHHGTERLNQLIGTSTGFGVRPTRGSYGWIGTLGKIYGGAHLAKMGLEYTKYADYLAGQALDFVPGMDETTPSEYAVQGYAGAMVMRQKLREELGLQQMAAYSERLMPGSMNLPGMTVIRSIGPIAAGALARGRTGAALGGLVSGLIGGTDPDMTSQDLADIYSGKKKEAVMKNRGWMMGLQPYGGNEIDYYRQNWVARYTSNFRYTDVQYGSKSEYFSYESSALTPHNLFGALKVLSPDHYAEKHYYNRPYTYSTSGERMHEGEELIAPPGRGAYQAQALGYEPNPGTYTMGVSPTSNSGMFRRGMDQVTQLGGIYKFAAQQLPFYNDLFGEGKGEEMYAAQAGSITSSSREFFDESVGGLLGMTELLRRFMSPDYGKQGINMIPNTMPNWMPGSRSIFANDQDYFTDFTTGDPYARVPMGEARLPGPGYEALAELHSKTPGVYDAYDRYKILADVAPYSEAFKNYRTIVQSWALSGALDKSTMAEFEQTEGQVRNVLDGPEYTPRIFSGIRSGTPEQLAVVNQFSAPERAIGAAWEHVTHDLIPNIGRVVPVLGTMLDRKLLGQRSAYESYLEDQVYGTDFHDWRRPWESMTAPRIMNLAASNPVTATAGGVGLGMVFGASPLGVATGIVGGASLGIFSTGRSIATGQLRGGWTPPSFDQRSSLESYFDAIEYERAQTNFDAANSMGRADLASEFRFQRGRTSVGMNYAADDIAYMSAAKFRLGSPMKKYAWQFLQAPAESRSAIMDVAPEMAQPILAGAWARQGDSRFRRSPNASPDQRAAEAIEHYGMPEASWGGWSPDVPMKAIKVRTLDSYSNHAYDMHKYNLWEADRRMTDRHHPGLQGAF